MILHLLLLTLAVWQRNTTKVFFFVLLSCATITLKIYWSTYRSIYPTKWLKMCSGGTSWLMAFRTREVQPILLQNARKSVCREVMWRHSDCCTPSNWDSYKQCYLWLLPSSSSPGGRSYRTKRNGPATIWIDGAICRHFLSTASSRALWRLSRSASRRKTFFYFPPQKVLQLNITGSDDSF